MFDFKNNSFNGVEVAYATLPMYMFNVISLDNGLTTAAKLVFIRLMAYASAKHSTTFGITPSWLADNTGLNRATVSRALSLLRQHGYVDDDGIVMCAPPEKAQRVSNKSAPSKVVHKVIHSVNVFQESQVEQPSVQINPIPEISNVVDAEDMDDRAQKAAQLRALMGIRSRVNPSVDVQNCTSTQEKDATFCTNDVRKSDKMFEKAASHITIPNNNHLLNTPCDSTEPTTGVFCDSPQSGSVRTVVNASQTKSKHVSSFLPSFEKPKTAQGNPVQPVASVSIGNVISKNSKLTRKTTAYIESALIRMRANTADRERYADEIGYACTRGSFAATEPLKAVRACLNIIERGAWTAPAGMY